MSMRNTWRPWAYTFLVTVISGSANQVLSFLGISGAQALGINVPSLNWNSVWVMFCSAAFVHALTYLAKSPLPKDEETIIVTKETTTIETKVTKDETNPPNR